MLLVQQPQRLFYALVSNLEQLVWVKSIGKASPVNCKCLTSHFSASLTLGLNYSSYAAMNVAPDSEIKDEPSKSSDKRKLEDNQSTSETEEKKAKGETDLNRETGKIRPKKFAICLSYCGVNYWGLQRNANVKTIEGEFFDALLKANLIKPEQYEKPQEFHFQRAARTDKGVSAIKQILSCRLPEWFPEKIPVVNSLLPPEIRLIAAKKTTRFFDCKNYCDARTYAYMMPSYALASMEESVSPSFRATPNHIEKFNDLLKKYVGTHNFYNFTSQKAPTDPSSMRFIMKMECGQSFVKRDIEFVVVRVRGQSFMMHQIRKMIGLAIGVMRGYASEDVIDRAFDLERLDIPKAPGLGLMLEEVHYLKYNKKYSGDGIHEALIWDEYNDVIQKFTEEYIYPVILDTEVKELSMMKWLELLPIHTFDLRKSGPPIPLEDLLGKDGDRQVLHSTAYFEACRNAELIGPREFIQEKDADGPVEVNEDADKNADVES